MHTCAPVPIGIVKRPVDFQTSAVARRLRRSCSKCSRETREIGDQRVPLEFLRGEANSPSFCTGHASKILQLCWCKKGRLNVWSTFRFLATWRSRLDPSFTGSGGSSAIAINWRRAQTRAQISFDDSGVSSNLVSTNKTLTPFPGFPGARWPMRSSVADSRGEVSTEEILSDVAMTMVMRTKEIHSFARTRVSSWIWLWHAMQSRSRSNRSVIDVHSLCKRSLSKELSDGAWHTDSRMIRDSRIPWPTRSLGYRALTLQRKREADEACRRPDPCDDSSVALGTVWHSRGWIWANSWCCSLGRCCRSNNLCGRCLCWRFGHRSRTLRHRLVRKLERFQRNSVPISGSYRLHQPWRMWRPPPFCLKNLCRWARGILTHSSSSARFSFEGNRHARSSATWAAVLNQVPVIRPFQTDWRVAPQQYVPGHVRSSN